MHLQPFPHSTVVFPVCLVAWLIENFPLWFSAEISHFVKSLICWLSPTTRVCTRGSVGTSYEITSFPELFLTQTACWPPRRATTCMGILYLSVYLGCTQTCHSDVLILELLKKLFVIWKVPSQSSGRALPKQFLVWNQIEISWVRTILIPHSNDYALALRMSLEVIKDHKRENASPSRTCARANLNQH